MSFFVRARFEVHEGRQAEFEELALALRKQAVHEPGTLTFRWFSAGANCYIAIEQYGDAAAAMEHNRRGADLLARVGQCAEIIEAEVYGALGPGVEAWIRSNPQVTAYPDFPGPTIVG
jgi:quinol monooxygenase YgiN